MNRSTLTSGVLRRLRALPDDRQRGFAEAGVAVTGAALVLGAALGSGVASTVVSMSDGVTWLPDEQTGQVVQVNPGTGEAERRLQVAEPGTELEISQHDGRLVVTDAGTGAITSIDLATLLASGQRHPEDPARVLVGGGRMYLVSASTGLVRVVDPLTLEDLADPYRVGGPLADAVVDAQGVVWVVTTRGDVRPVEWRPEERRFAAGDVRPVRGAGAGTRLLPHARGVTVFSPDSGAVVQVGVGRDVAVAVPDLSGEVLPAATAPKNLAPAGVPGRSSVVMLTGERFLEVGVGDLGCRRPGRPAVFSGLVYVPCTGAGRVLVLTAEGKRARPDVVVPVGRDPRLLVDDGRLVVHTEDGSRAVVVESDGRTRVVDTGRSDAAVHDPREGGGAPVAAPPPRQQPRDGAPKGPWQGGPWEGPPTAPAAPGLPPVPGVVPPAPGAPHGPTPDATPEPEDVAEPGEPAASPTAAPRPASGPTPGAADPPEPTPPVRRAPTAVTATVGEQSGAGVTVDVTWRGVTPAPEWYVVEAVADPPDARAMPKYMSFSSLTYGDEATTATLRVWCGTEYTFTVTTRDGTTDTSPAGVSRPLRTPACEEGRVPAAPEGVTASAGADGAVTVTWQPASGGADSYLVGPEGGSMTSTPGTSTSLVLRDVPPGEAVRFVVQTVLDSRTAASEPSAPVTVAGPPGAPVQVESNRAGADTDGGREIGVVWGEAPANGSPVTGYDLTWSGGGLSGSLSTTSTYASVELNCQGLPLCHEGGPVTITVVASNAVGTGPGYTYVYDLDPYGRPVDGDTVVTSVYPSEPELSDPGVPMHATLAPPEWWAAHTGGCTLVVTWQTTTTEDVPCTGGDVPLGSFYGGGGSVTVAVRAEGVGGGSVTSAAATVPVPDRDTFPTCFDKASCHDPGIGWTPPPEVVVAGVVRSSPVRDASERPVLTASGLGLLVAAGALRFARRRRDGLSVATPAGHEEGTG